MDVVNSFLEMFSLTKVNQLNQPNLPNWNQLSKTTKPTKSTPSKSQKIQSKLVYLNTQILSFYVSSFQNAFYKVMPCIHAHIYWWVKKSWGWPWWPNTGNDTCEHNIVSYKSYAWTFALFDVCRIISLFSPKNHSCNKTIE